MYFLPGNGINTTMQFTEHFYSRLQEGLKPKLYDVLVQCTYMKKLTAIVKSQIQPATCIN